MRPWLQWLRRLLLAAVALGLLAALGLAALLWTVWPQLPDMTELRRVELQLPLRIESADGQLIALFGETRRFPVPVEAIPDHVRNAFLAAEDARFFEHHGLDFIGIGRAVWLLVSTDRTRVPGGSTITQQVARGFFLSPEYSIVRKLREMLLAVKMERVLSKDEILGLYLNKIFFGHRAYGVAAAAEFYFGKSLDELTLAEAAMLAGIPKFPSSANPISNPERAMIRRNHYVLPRMLALGMIDEAEFQVALAEPNRARPHEPSIEVDAPFLAEMVRQAMVERFGDAALTAGFRVVTSVRSTDQNAAALALRRGLVNHERRRSWRGAEGRIENVAALDAQGLDAALRDYPPLPELPAAVVLSIDEQSATLHARRLGAVRLETEALRWARRSASGRLQPGDVVRLFRAAPEEDWQLAQAPRAEAALVALEADNGAVRALVGGYSFARTHFNRAVQARRQPGSSFKPFLFAAAFERGYSPASIVLDAPVVFRDRAGNVWRPQNVREDFAGPMRLREAMVESRNLVAVRLLDAIGVQYAQRYLGQFGFTPESVPANLSLSLGTASLTPLEITRGFAAFANGGYLVEPWFIARVYDRHGVLVMQSHPALACPGCIDSESMARRAGALIDGFDFGSTPAPRLDKVRPDALAMDLAAGLDQVGPPELRAAPRAIDARTAFQVHSMMQDVVRRGTGRGARALGRQDVGGKTGSTNDHRDAWFTGFGGDLVTTVWVGRDDFSPLGDGEYGGRVALPIWTGFMAAALEGAPENLPALPSGLQAVSIDPLTGALLPPGAGGIIDYLRSEDLDRLLASGPLLVPSGGEEQAFDVF